MVVCGIIVALIALLVPSGVRAREMGRRARCESNLRQIGVAAHCFAAEHDQRLPASYFMPNTKYPFRFPSVVSYNPATEKTFATWTTYGTPWQTFAAYGATEGVWDCPSNGDGVRIFDGKALTAPAEWGVVAFTDYMYLAGTTSTNCGKSVPKWGVRDTLGGRFRR